MTVGTSGAEAAIMDLAFPAGVEVNIFAESPGAKIASKNDIEEVGINVILVESEKDVDFRYKYGEGLLSAGLLIDGYVGLGRSSKRKANDVTVGTGRFDIEVFKEIFNAITDATGENTDLKQERWLREVEDTATYNLSTLGLCRSRYTIDPEAAGTAAKSVVESRRILNDFSAGFQFAHVIDIERSGGDDHIARLPVCGNVMNRRLIVIAGSSGQAKIPQNLESVECIKKFFKNIKDDSKKYFMFKKSYFGGSFVEVV